MHVDFKVTLPAFKIDPFAENNPLKKDSFWSLSQLWNVLGKLLFGKVSWENSNSFNISLYPVIYVVILQSILNNSATSKSFGLKHISKPLWTLEDNLERTPSPCINPNFIYSSLYCLWWFK